MPKITAHGGPSNAAAPTRIEIIAEDGPELISLPDGVTVLPRTEEESSPGNSSETSSTKDVSSPKPSGSRGRSRARTTASPSKPGPTADSTAPSTDGDPTAADGGEG
nr:hypothetical protein [Streptomyces sp. TLI_235]